MSRHGVAGIAYCSFVGEVAGGVLVADGGFPGDRGRCASPSALDPRGAFDDGSSRDSAELFAEKTKTVFSRQDDARDERGLGRMESKPTGKAGGTAAERADGIEAPGAPRSLRVLGNLGRSVHSIQNRHIRRTRNTDLFNDINFSLLAFRSPWKY